jgi:hypothetical protein
MRSIAQESRGCFTTILKKLAEITETSKKLGLRGDPDFWKFVAGLPSSSGKLGVEDLVALSKVSDIFHIDQNLLYKLLQERYKQALTVCNRNDFLFLLENSSNLSNREFFDAAFSRIQSANWSPCEWNRFVDIFSMHKSRSPCKVLNYIILKHAKEIDASILLRALASWRSVAIRHSSVVKDLLLQVNPEYAAELLPRFAKIFNQRDFNTLVSSFIRAEAVNIEIAVLLYTRCNHPAEILISEICRRNIDSFSKRESSKVLKFIESYELNDKLSHWLTTQIPFMTSYYIEKNNVGNILNILLKYRISSLWDKCSNLILQTQPSMFSCSQLVAILKTMYNNEHVYQHIYRELTERINHISANEFLDVMLVESTREAASDLGNMVNRLMEAFDWDKLSDINQRRIVQLEMSRRSLIDNGLDILSGRDTQYKFDKIFENCGVIVAGPMFLHPSGGFTIEFLLKFKYLNSLRRTLVVQDESEIIPGFASIH